MDGKTMKNISFKNINKLGQPVFEDDRFKHIHHPEFLLMYDSNFIEFKKMPTLDELIEAEEYLKAFHLKNGQEHVKFCFPENEQLRQDLIDYLTKQNYNVGFLELYAIQPKHFPTGNDRKEIEIMLVKAENLEAFLKMQYEIDLEFGRNFAIQKQAQHQRNFQNGNLLQIMAFYKGEPAGSVDVIISNDTAEIDGLTVLESLRNKGIGSMLQKFVMNQFFDKTVILVADGEDTPKEMYRKQNYHYLGFKYEAVKIIF